MTWWCTSAGRWDGRRKSGNRPATGPSRTAATTGRGPGSASSPAAGRRGGRGAARPTNTGARPGAGNTLAGIRRATEAGAHVAEVDIRTTKDGALVCMHDPDVDRTTDGTGKVATLTLADIRKLDAGAKFDAKYKGERVPTLREVLEL